MFYVFPLRFLFTVATVNGSNTMAPREVPYLMALFGIGFAAIYALLASLYGHALQQAEHLQLNPIEAALTSGYRISMLGVASVGLLSSLVAWLLPYRHTGYAALTYLLISPLVRFMRRRNRLSAAALAGPATAP